MKHIVILGGGPRGLAVALQAALSNYQVSIIDTHFLSTWSFPNMVDNLQMRSPKSFDITTLNPNLYNYSLSKFLNIPIQTKCLTDVENINIFCSRINFYNYLQYVIKILKQLNVRFITTKINTINTHNLITEKNSIINFDALVIATGRLTQTVKTPSFLKNQNVTIENIYNTDWNNKEVYIVGDGQQSAEYVNYLCSQKAKVTWLIKKDPIVSQYPVPSHKEWGVQSAFSNFYKDQYTQSEKNIYLENVKKWGPSITPYINNLISKYSINVLKDIKTTKELNIYNPFILATGYEQDIDLLNFSFNLKRDKYNNKLPSISKHFQSTSNPNIYFTGLLALRYDGPRQGSILSSANTAKTILNSIENNNG